MYLSRNFKSIKLTNTSEMDVNIFVSENLQPVIKVMVHTKKHAFEYTFVASCTSNGYSIDNTYSENSYFEDKVYHFLNDITENKNTLYVKNQLKRIAKLLYKMNVNKINLYNNDLLELQLNENRVLRNCYGGLKTIHESLAQLQLLV